MSVDAVTALMLGFFGGVLGGLAVQRLCDKEYRRRIEQLEDERDELVEEARRKAEKGLRSREKAIQRAEKELTNYEELSREYTGEKREKEDDDIYKIIDEHQFVQSMSVVDNETIVFYQKDGVLTDSCGEPIPNSVNLLGYEALTTIEDTTDDFVYVTNEKLEKMFEISIEHDKSFYQDVMEGGVGY